MSSITTGGNGRPNFPGIVEEVSLYLPGGEVPVDVQKNLFRDQIRIRRFEERAYDLYMRSLVKGSSHLSIGMEAVAAGFGEAMNQSDYTLATYRCHAHALARGTSMVALMGELLGRECGLMHGKGGSMHLTDVTHGLLGSYAIVGAHLPVALGAAWASQYRGDGSVTVAFFGDGATNIGAFHESMNFAKVWNLPIVFVCENNFYMEYTPIRAMTAVPFPAADRAPSYGMERVCIDGNDVEVVYLTAVEAISRAREGEGPSIIEALTYRQGGHSRADPGKYRPVEEVQAWTAYDPIPLYRRRLINQGVDAAELDGLDAEARSEVDVATAAAEASPPPDPSAVLVNLWSDGSASWRN